MLWGCNVEIWFIGKEGTKKEVFLSKKKKLINIVWNKAFNLFIKISFIKP